MAGRGGSDERSADVVLDLLADQRRRDVLACLEGSTQSIPLTELAEDIAARENEGSLTEVPNAEVRTIQLSLHHVHLPKLDDAGAVEYDRDRNLTRASEPTDRVERALSLIEAVDER
ncbi:DUF7344 domain-containing protein [Halorarum salinum]|uniref:DUF7344 domain-containing protein n=1 Tax=Halorarum salinum TaxID=2743089 RepID=A0A7D5QA89_9EURY|nr:hypothetical protein [Halobaculum salinum]QLG60740.1 hypothetical protein HUG12_02855 [Halobaculum salinum]